MADGFARSVRRSRNEIMTPCAICHRQTPETRQAFLDGCFHVFCYECIVQWSQRQRDEGCRTLQCPLCRTEYRSVFHSCIHRSFRSASQLPWVPDEREVFNRRHWLDEDDAEEEIFLTAGHMERRAVYVSKDAAQTSRIHRPVEAVLKRRLVTDAQAQQWIRRELEAVLMTHDVQFLVDLVTYVVRDANKEEAEKKLRLSLEPFLHENAGLFATELRSFLASGLNVCGYDAFLENAR